MDKRIWSAIVMCAAMVVVAAAPIAMSQTDSIHEIVKGDKGPRASAVTWTFVPPDYGVWYGHIVNNGLRWLVIDVCDNTSGAPLEILHQRIRFAAYDAYPSGVVDTIEVSMAPNRVYEVTATPNGPKGSMCTVEDMFRTAVPPTAVMTVTVNYLQVIVDGSGSYDDGTIVSYEWNFGDGATATGMTATHTYANDGTYTITLTVTDNDGLKGTARETVTVQHQLIPPVASFTATMDWMTVSVDARGSSDDRMIVSYDWDWGDGSPHGSGVTATHTYAMEGTYTITLTVTDDDGLTASASKDVQAVQKPVEKLPPVASFIAIANYLEVSVDASASYDPDGTIVSYDWDWGDGSPHGSGVTATHAYASDGTYTIVLTVTDNDGLTGTASKAVSVRHQPIPPVAMFTVTVDGLTVQVDASGSYDPDGTIVSYDWDWGDGSPHGSGVTATHTYVAPSGSSGTSGTKQVLVLKTATKLLGGGVIDQPAPPYMIFGFTYDASGKNPIPDCTVTITNTATGASVVTYSDSYGYYSYDLNLLGWKSGDIIHVKAEKGTLVGEADATAGVPGYIWLDITLVETAPPPQPFEVTITLTVTDSDGLTASFSRTVTLYP